MITPDDQVIDVVEPSIASAAFIREHADFTDLIHVYGDVDLSNSADMERAINMPRAVDRGVVVDLGNCNYMDSTGLSVLVRAKKMLGAQLKILKPENGNVSRLFELSGLATFLV